MEVPDKAEQASSSWLLSSAALSPHRLAALCLLDLDLMYRAGSRRPSAEMSTTCHGCGAPAPTFLASHLRAGLALHSSWLFLLSTACMLQRYPRAPYPLHARSHPAFQAHRYLCLEELGSLLRSVKCFLCISCALFCVAYVHDCRPGQAKPDSNTSHVCAAFGILCLVNIMM